MKHNLGNILKCYFLLSLALLWAEDFAYTVKVNTETPYVKEPVLLSVDLNQTNHDIVLLFNFDLKKSQDYAFQRLDAKETDSHHDAKVHYTYLIYPLRSGEVNLHFSLIKKVTTDESVAYSFSGDRDNVKGLVSKDSLVSLPPLTLHVKALPANTDLVGDFKLTHIFNKHKAKAYEPIPFQIRIEGEGYTPLIKKILPAELNVTQFTEKPIVNSSHTHKGSRSTVIYPMALSHDRSFDLPKIVLRGFNPKTEKSYTLSIPAQHFDVKQEDTAILLDKVDSPKAFTQDFGWIKTLFSYLIVFAAGYLSALTFKWRKKQKPQGQTLLQEKIHDCKDARSLLQVLMAADSKQFRTIIEDLENGLYKNAKINLNKLKQRAIEEAS